MNTINKPTFLLWLPVVVWAATFTLLTYTFYFHTEAYPFTGALKTGFAIGLFINIVVLTYMIVSAAQHQKLRKELLIRGILLISNLPLLFIYNYVTTSII